MEIHWVSKCFTFSLMVMVSLSGCRWWWEAVGRGNIQDLDERAAPSMWQKVSEWSDTCCLAAAERTRWWWQFQVAQMTSLFCFFLEDANLIVFVCFVLVCLRLVPVLIKAGFFCWHKVHFHDPENCTKCIYCYRNNLTLKNLSNMTKIFWCSHKVVFQMFPCCSVLQKIYQYIVYVSICGSGWAVWPLHLTRLHHCWHVWPTGKNRTSTSPILHECHIQ